MKHVAKRSLRWVLLASACVLFPIPQSCLAQSGRQVEPTGTRPSETRAVHISFVHVMDVIPVKGAKHITAHNQASQRRIVAFAPTVAPTPGMPITKDWAACVDAWDGSVPDVRRVCFVDSATAVESRAVLQDARVYPGDMTLSADGSLALTLNLLQSDGSLAGNAPTFLWVLPSIKADAHDAKPEEKKRPHLQVAEGDLRLPQWSADGKSLYFWRKIADEKRTHDSTEISFASWQLFHATPPWNAPHTESIAGTESRAPYSIFAGSGLAVCWPRVAPASLAPGVMNVVHLPDSNVTRFPLPNLSAWSAPDSVHWSGDSQFVALSFNDGSLPSNRTVEVMRLSTGQITDINARLEKFVRGILPAENARHVFAINGFASLGRTTRYLVSYKFMDYPSDSIMPAHESLPQPEDHWLVYDADNEHIDVADGLPKHWSGQLLATPDGRFVQVGRVNGLFERQ